jgi:hypothetical protein
LEFEDGDGLGFAVLGEEDVLFAEFVERVAFAVAGAEVDDDEVGADADLKFGFLRREEGREEEEEAAHGQNRKRSMP